MSTDIGCCAVCADPKTEFQRQCRCPHCNWYLCAKCFADHFKLDPAHLDHPASASKCRGRKDVR